MINKERSWFFEKWNKIDKVLYDWLREERWYNLKEKEVISKDYIGIKKLEKNIRKNLVLNNLKNFVKLVNFYKN